MRCDQFEQRLQHCLDERVKLEHDEQLAEHAAACAVCRRELEAWRVIDSVVADPVGASHAVSGFSESRGRWMTWAIAALAASLLLTIVLLDGRNDPATANRQRTTIDQHADVPVTEAATQWWSDVRQRDWVAETMPTVRSLQDGVAPIGRSLVRAAAILAVGTGHKTT